jgi:hypothetical protein
VCVCVCVGGGGGGSIERVTNGENNIVKRGVQSNKDNQSAHPKRKRHEISNRRHGCERVRRVTASPTEAKREVVEGTKKGGGSQSTNGRRRPWGITASSRTKNTQSVVEASSTVGERRGHVWEMKQFPWRWCVWDEVIRLSMWWSVREETRWLKSMVRVRDGSKLKNHKCC